MGRRQKTHERLREAGLALFEENGFDNTTVAAIVAAQGVSQMTFYRHFPTRAHILALEQGMMIQRAIGIAPRGLAPAEAVIWGLKFIAQHLDPTFGAEVCRRLAIIAASRELPNIAFGPTSGLHQLVAEGLVARGVADPVASVAAGHVLGVVGSVVCSYEPPEDLLAFVTLVDSCHSLIVGAVRH